ncbi:MAG TPA: 3-hydroxyacyl-CoA dehydrogenase [Syntrophomonadaceae bacterium]|nr:3-hydroxyacyl-CoA dehydrogenase [Syntrophomonadaceae bacterium]HQA08000.1 3-hydroxyacyl-CoA dehydrogenase [Syntrophomonadaceae bacterium]HQE23212.1 3-hydroxyacyl-CoA dehydrogenase [Syntrophomonadaceae bacterium]
MKIAGKTAIVTGGASGLGEAAVIRLHAAGANVVIADLNEEKGNALAAKLGDKAVFVKCNVTSVDDVKAAVNTAVEKFGALHILVNNAGIGSAGRTIGKDGPWNIEWFKMVVDINLVGAFNMLSNAAYQMDKNEPEDGEKGVIINVASVAAFDGQIGQAAYSASKGGVVAMTLPIARDLSRHLIRVNTIAPGTFDTPMLAQLPQAARDSLAASIPMPQRLGNPEEFAHLVQAIVENNYLNAETIRLDGAIRMAPK